MEHITKPMPALHRQRLHRNKTCMTKHQIVCTACDTVLK